MALVYVGGTTGTAVGGTTDWTISLTSLTGGIASSPSIGDVVIVFGASGYASSASVYDVAGIGYQPIAGKHGSGTTSVARINATYKRLTVADTTVTLNGSLDAKAAAAAVVQVWRNVSTLTPPHEAVLSAHMTSGAGSGRPDPGAITPVTAGAVVIVGGVAASAAGAVFTSSDLTDFLSVTSPDTTDVMVGAGYYPWTSGTFDAAQFGGGTTGAGDGWAALAIALKPYVAPTINFPATAASFTRTGVQASFVLKPYKIAAVSRALSFTGFATGLTRAVAPKIIARIPPSSSYVFRQHLLSGNGRTLVVTDTYYIYLHRRVGNNWVLKHTVSGSFDPSRATISYDGNVMYTKPTADRYLRKLTRQPDETWTVTDPVDLLETWDMSISTNYDGSRVVVADANPLKIGLYSVVGGTATKLAGAVPSSSVAGVTFGAYLKLSNDGDRCYAFDPASGVTKYYEFTYSAGTLTETMYYAHVSAGSYGWYGGDVLDDGSRFVAVRDPSGNMNNYNVAVYVRTGATLDPPLIYSSLRQTWPFDAVFSDDGASLWITEEFNPPKIKRFAWTGTAYVFAEDLKIAGTYAETGYADFVSVGCNGNVVAGAARLYDNPGVADSGAIVLWVVAEPTLFLMPQGFAVTGAEAGLIVYSLNQNFPADAGAHASTFADAALTKSSAQQQAISAAAGVFLVQGSATANAIVASGGYFSLSSPGIAPGRAVLGAAATAITVVGRDAAVGIYAPALVDKSYVGTFPTQFAGYRWATISPTGARLFAREGTYTDDMPVESFTITASSRTFTLEDTIPDPAGIPSDEFGFDPCAFSSDELHVLIPARGDRAGSIGPYAPQSVGSVYYYTRSGGNWSFQQKIQPSQIFPSQLPARFGASLSMAANGLRAIAAAPGLYDAVTYGGGALFVLNRSGNTWTSSVIDYSSIGYSALGDQSAMSADGLTVAYNINGTQFRIKKYNGSTWPTIATFTAGVKKIAVNADGTQILVLTTEYAIVYVLSGGVWGVGTATSLPSLLNLDTATFNVSNPSLKYFSVEGDEIRHYHTDRPDIAPYTALTTPDRNLLRVGSATDNHTILLWPSVVGSTYDLAFYWQVPNITFQAAKASFNIARYPAAYARAMRAAAVSLSTTYPGTLLLRGKPMYAGTGTYSLVGAATKLAYRRAQICAPATFSNSFAPVAFMKVKGALSADPTTLVVAAPLSRIARLFTVQADGAVVSVGYPPAQVARIFSLTAEYWAGRYALEATTCRVIMDARGGVLTLLGGPQSLRHHAVVLAAPATFELRMTPSAMRSPMRSALAVTTFGEAISTQFRGEAIYVQQ